MSKVIKTEHIKCSRARGEDILLLLYDNSKSEIRCPRKDECLELEEWQECPYEKGRGK